MSTQTKETPPEIVALASLKEVRKKLGKTQTQIATEVGIRSYQMIMQIESGQRLIPKNRVVSFAKAYDVPVEQLSKLWVKKTPLKQQFGADGNMDVLPIIKAVAKCDVAQLTLNEFSKLLEYTSPLQNCTPELIKAILACGFK